MCCSLAVAWNKLLFDTFVPRAWLALLETIANGRASLELYDILPPLQDRRTSGDAQYWTSLLRDVVGLALERDAPVWPELSGSTSTSSNTYTRLINALVASWNDKSEHLEMLVKAGIVVIRPPSHVNEVLLESRSQHKLTPENVRPQLSVSLQSYPFVISSNTYGALNSRLVRIWQRCHVRSATS